MADYRHILYTEEQLETQLTELYEALNKIAKAEQEAQARGSDGRSAQWHQPNRLATEETIAAIQKALHKKNPTKYPSLNAIAFISLQVCP